jgi:hypothetical protein
METLGLSDSTPRSEGRLKSLFWPSIQNGSDVDYLGVQGYWVCLLVAMGSLILLAAMSQPIMAVATFLFYFLGGVGVRERSRYAAAVVFAMYFVDTLISFGVIRIIFTALMLSNLRATWIAATWKGESEEAILPPRLNESFSDKLADQLPAWLWPKLRIVYYIYSAAFLLLVAVGLVVLSAETKLHN